MPRAGLHHQCHTTAAASASLWCRHRHLICLRHRCLIAITIALLPSPHHRCCCVVYRASPTRGAMPRTPRPHATWPSTRRALYACRENTLRNNPRPLLPLDTSACVDLESATDSHGSLFCRSTFSFSHAGLLHHSLSTWDATERYAMYKSHLDDPLSFQDGGSLLYRIGALFSD